VPELVARPAAITAVYLPDFLDDLIEAQVRALRQGLGR
jgi:hypothetical protein